MSSADRWSLPDMDQALEWCSRRNRQGISCTLHILGEYATSKDPVLAMANKYHTLLDKIQAKKLHATISVKPTSVGEIFNRSLSMETLRDLASAAAEYGVGIEIDMEGTGLVDASIRAAISCAGEGHSVTLALQSYLDRTSRDLRDLLSKGVTPRIVKGAYIGDTDDFFEIEDRFKEYVSIAEESGKSFHIGTHDPDLLEWFTARMMGKRDLVQVGMLMGLSDQTKLRLAAEGWDVSEYVPFGWERAAYEARREKYLSDIAKKGRKTAP